MRMQGTQSTGPGTAGVLLCGCNRSVHAVVAAAASVAVDAAAVKPVPTAVSNTSSGSTVQLKYMLFLNFVIYSYNKHANSDAK